MRNPPDAVMIFAAGFGTRMKDLTKDRPKPMIPVAGRPLIDHALEHIDKANITNRVANVHYKPEALMAHLKALGVMISDERAMLLETGGGLKNALALLPDGPVFTMNSDVIFQGPNPFDPLRAAWDPEKMDALLLLIPVANAKGTSNDGDFVIGPTGALSRGAGHIYSGIQIINPKVVTEVNDTAFSLNVVWNRLQQNGRLFGTVYDGTWCDVGHPAGILIAETMLEGHNV